MQLLLKDGAGIVVKHRCRPSRRIRFEQLSNPHVVSLHEVTVRIRGPDACAIYFM